MNVFDIIGYSLVGLGTLGVVCKGCVNLTRKWAKRYRYATLCDLLNATEEEILYYKGKRDVSISVVETAHFNGILIGLRATRDRLIDGLAKLE